MLDAQPEQTQFENEEFEMEKKSIVVVSLDLSDPTVCFLSSHSLVVLPFIWLAHLWPCRWDDLCWI